MQQSDIFWNDEARAKILEDSDRVLREAVLELAGTHAGSSWEDIFAELHARLKDRFIDFEPGPDLRKYAEAIANGEFSGSGSPDDDPDDDDRNGDDPDAPAPDAPDSETGESRGGAGAAATAPTGFSSTDPAVNSTGTADGVQASDADPGTTDEVVNDG